MKTLIAYAGHTGTTKFCAEQLAAQLPSTILVDLSAEKNVPDLDAYDLVIIGSNVRIGMFHKAVRRLLKEQQAALSQKQTAFFICHALPEGIEEIIRANVPEALRDSALRIDSFGGQLDMDKLKGASRLIAKMAANASSAEGAPVIHTERIEAFAQALQ
jgi:menaquinone-dependent protoporphyrinogen oxidase